MTTRSRRHVDRVLRAWSIASLTCWVALLAAAVATTTNVHAVATGVAAEEPAAATLQQRRSQAQTTVDEVSSGVMCPTCDSTLDESNSPAAQRMRAWVEAAVAAGWTEQEIRDGLVEEYGGDESILAVPRAEGLGVGIWVVPVVVVLSALLGAIVTLRRWKRAGRTPDAATEGVASRRD